MTNHAILNTIEKMSQQRKAEILSAADAISVSGVRYYVRADGCDENDGLSPKSAWRSLKKVTETKLNPGDGVFFRRGDVFRGFVNAQAGVTYAAFGTGDKPKFYGWDRNLCDPAQWVLFMPVGEALH